MEQVLKCEYCSTTMSIGREIWMDGHEYDCAFNPYNRSKFDKEYLLNLEKDIKAILTVEVKH